MTRARLRVAVVDDEANVRRALGRLLRSLEFSVSCYESGGEFLASIPSQTHDCLVLDLHMPDLDGFAVLARLHDVCPRLPVVVITGRDTPEAQQRAAELGVAEYLRKPIEADDLAEAISAAVEGR